MPRVAHAPCLLNSNTTLAFAFYCDVGESPINSSPETLAEKIQSEFQVFLAINQQDVILDGVERVGDLPEDERDNGGRSREVGTLSNGSFSICRLANDLTLGDQLGLFTRLREEGETD